MRMELIEVGMEEEEEWIGIGRFEVLCIFFEAECASVPWLVIDAEIFEPIGGGGIER